MQHVPQHLRRGSTGLSGAFCSHFAAWWRGYRRRQRLWRAAARSGGACTWSWTGPGIRRRVTCTGGLARPKAECGGSSCCDTAARVPEGPRGLVARSCVGGGAGMSPRLCWAHVRWQSLADARAHCLALARASDSGGRRDGEQTGAREGAVGGDFPGASRIGGLRCGPSPITPPRRELHAGHSLRL